MLSNLPQILLGLWTKNSEVFRERQKENKRLNKQEVKNREYESIPPQNLKITGSRITLYHNLSPNHEVRISISQDENHVALSFQIIHGLNNVPKLIKNAQDKMFELSEYLFTEKDNSLPAIQVI